MRRTYKGSLIYHLSPRSHVKNTRKLLFHFSDSLSSQDSQQLAGLLKVKTILRIHKHLNISQKGESTVFLEIVYLELIKEQEGSEVLCPRLLKAIQEMGRCSLETILHCLIPPCSADLETSFLKLGAGICSCPRHAQEKKKDTVVVREFPDTEFYRTVGGHENTLHYHPRVPASA